MSFEVLERKDFEVTTINQIRITVYPKEKNGEEIAELCVIDLKTALYAVEIGYFVEFVPAIIKSQHFTKGFDESPPTLTVVPNQSFRVIKAKEKSGTVHTRVCIIPPKKFEENK